MGGEESEGKRRGENGRRVEGGEGTEGTGVDSLRVGRQGWGRELEARGERRTWKGRNGRRTGETDKEGREEKR